MGIVVITVAITINSEYNLSVSAPQPRPAAQLPGDHDLQHGQLPGSNLDNRVLLIINSLQVFPKPQKLSPSNYCLKDLDNEYAPETPIQ